MTHQTKNILLTLILALVLLGLTIGSLGSISHTVKAQGNPPTDCYRVVGGAKYVAASGCEYEFQSGSTLDIQSGATLDIEDGAAFSLGTDLYPVGSITQSQQIYCGATTFTGTTTVALATHGVTTPTAAIATLSEDPGAGAGDPFLVSSDFTTSTVTLKAFQDDATAATVGADVDYCVYGTD